MNKIEPQKIEVMIEEEIRIIQNENRKPKFLLVNEYGYRCLSIALARKTNSIVFPDNYMDLDIVFDKKNTRVFTVLCGGENEMIYGN